MLAPNGSLCIELGDTYAGAGAAESDGSARRERITDYGDGITKRWEDGATGYHSVPTKGTGWPLAKSLSLIPESFRFAMVYGFNPHTGRRTEPWRLRNVIRWVRPNPPVGALGDKFRPATSELMVFCKSAKRYFDLDAVRESPTSGKAGAFKQNFTAANRNAWRGQTEGAQERVGLVSHPAGAPPLDWWNIPLSGVSQPAVGGFDSPPPGEGNTCVHGKSGPHLTNLWPDEAEMVECTGPELPESENPAGAPPLDWWNIPLLEGEEETRYGPTPRSRAGDAGPAITSKSGGHGPGRTQADHERWARNLAVVTEHPLGAPPLDWWEIPPGGFSGAHYAVFPPELCVKPVKAMCPEKVCRVCGEPSRRITDVSYTSLENPELNRAEPSAGSRGRPVDRLALREQNTQAMANGRATKNVETLGFSDCGHDDWRPGMVLDPFVGSGTTLMVATGHGRDAIGIDIDDRNVTLAQERVGPFFFEVIDARPQSDRPDAPILEVRGAEE